MSKAHWSESSMRIGFRYVVWRIVDSSWHGARYRYYADADGKVPKFWTARAARKFAEQLNAEQAAECEAVLEGWRKLTDYLPPLGKYVLLCKDGVVQRFSFYLDQVDSDCTGGGYFWATDDVDMDEFPAADFERDYWMPIPASPTPTAGEVKG